MINDATDMLKVKRLDHQTGKDCDMICPIISGSS